MRCDMAVAALRPPPTTRSRRVFSKAKGRRDGAEPRMASPTAPALSPLLTRRPSCGAAKASTIKSVLEGAAAGVTRPRQRQRDRREERAAGGDRNWETDRSVAFLLTGVAFSDRFRAEQEQVAVVEFAGYAQSGCRRVAVGVTRFGHRAASRLRLRLRWLAIATVSACSLVVVALRGPTVEPISIFTLTSANLWRPDSASSATDATGYRRADCRSKREHRGRRGCTAQLLYSSRKYGSAI